MKITPEILRALTDDPEIMEAARFAIEDEAVDRRDRMIQVANRNGIAIFSKEGQPSPIIRISTIEAVHIALWAIAEKLEERKS
jgi:N-acyl-L-homoserine lactone synthetase